MKTDLRVGGRTTSCLRRIAHVLLAFACVAAAGCASSGVVPRPRPFPGAAVPPDTTPPPTATVVPPSAPPPGNAPIVVATALTYRGVPYRNGGSDPSGFDCSGFVQWVFAQHGVRLPREVREQYAAGRVIERDAIAPGDLVFFETVSNGPSHVGIALGGDEFVHAPSSRGVVRVERYTSEYWRTRYVGTRRVTASFAADAPRGAVQSSK